MLVNFRYSDPLTNHNVVKHSMACNVKTVKTENFDIRFKVNTSESRVTAEVADRLGNVKVVPTLNLPKEVSSIDSESLMCKYIDASHFKVSQLSDGEYKIYSSVSGFGGGTKTQRNSKQDRHEREGYHATLRVEVAKVGRREDEVNAALANKYNAEARAAYVKAGATGIATVIGIILAACMCSIF